MNEPEPGGRLFWPSVSIAFKDEISEVFEIICILRLVIFCVSD